MLNALVFDCTGKDIFVAYWNGKEVLIEEKMENASGTEYLMQSIDCCLKKASISIGEIDCIGICVGPGSWTGCRVAVATLNGLIAGMAKKPKIFTFDTFDTFAYNTEKDSKKEDVFFALPAYGQNLYVKQVVGAKNPCIEPFMQIDRLLSIIRENFAECYSTEKIFDGSIVVGQDYKKLIKRKIANNEFVLLEDVEPLYIRPSQAEIQLTERLNRGK